MIRARTRGSIDSSEAVNHRTHLRPGDPHEVDIEHVREGSVVGTLAKPRGLSGAPGVILLPSSVGGIPAAFAVELASEGFTALALAYFGIEPLPPELIEVPVEFLSVGIEWLRASGLVPSGRTGIVGQSKGSEYALVAASLLPVDVAIAAYVPSSVSWPGVIRWDPSREFKGSWTWRGAPLPFLQYHVTPEFDAESASGRPVRLSILYGASLDQAEAAEAAGIAVEHVRGPLLLISGEDDQMWPSSRMAEALIARLKANNHPYEFSHLSYAGAGHFAGPPSFSAGEASSGGHFNLGGSPEGNAAARADSWPA